MDTAIVVFTRDLRLHDNPALHQACSRARQVVPLFVLDPALKPPPNRARFLAESLADLRESLRARGSDLVIRPGSPAAEIIRLATETRAAAVYMAGDVSRYAARRRQALQQECARHRLDLTVTPGLTVVPPGDLRPAAADHYRVFTPYYRAWRATPWRHPCPVPDVIRTPKIRLIGRIPPIPSGTSPALPQGGESPARHRLSAWLDPAHPKDGEQAARRRLSTWPDLARPDGTNAPQPCSPGLAAYPAHHDDLPADQTSRLSPYLKFGCLSPLELALAALDPAALRPSSVDPAAHSAGEEFCRQLAWRDFFYQVTAAFPDIASKDYRPAAHPWREDPDALEAWRAGRTGIPIVDAGLRQLAAEGFMHNRARMITASFLTRNLGLDWRHGYRHFAALLADADVANNAGNWQWVAGTGNNTRPNRIMNPLRQASRFDPSGDYVRRYVQELSALDRPHIHTPWRLPAPARRQLGYPAPIAELT
jgi:deoxyribodipyrimidine photo-lyase